MTEKKDIIRYSISMEELALVFGLVGMPQAGRDVLTTIYENLAEDQANTLLTAASHSLLARGLTFLDENQKIKLDDDFNKFIQPLINFDYVFTLILTYGQETVSVTFQVKKNDRFISQLVKGGVVHILESGPKKLMPSYVLDLLAGFGSSAVNENAWHNLKTTLDAVGSALKAARAGQPMDQKIFKQYGWSDAALQALADDLRLQSGYGTLLRVDAGNTDENPEAAARKTLFLLKGKTRCWLFDFPGAADDTVGKASLVTRQDFEKLLTTFIQ